MKFQEGQFSNRSLSQSKHKTKGIILLTDNRPKQVVQKGSINNFRQSAFKQTDVDPNQVWAEFTIPHDEELYLQQLNRKVLILEERVKKLQKICEAKQNQKGIVFQEKDRKHRRRFVQMERKHKCHFKECQKIYGSDTALKHHLKIKHKVISEQKGSDGRQNKENREQMKADDKYFQ